MKKIAEKLSALTFHMDNFDGSDAYPPDLFVSSLRQYLILTGNISPAQIRNIHGVMIANPDKDLVEKQILRNHLRGDALSWYNQLDDDTSFENCLTQLVERFELTPHQKHLKRLAVYQMQQKVGERYETYVSRVLSASLGLKLADQDVLTVVTQGAEPRIRNFLIMKQPKSVSELMALPLARGGSVNMYQPDKSSN